MMLVCWFLEFWLSEGSAGGEAPLLAAAIGGGRANFFENGGYGKHWKVFR